MTLQLDLGSAKLTEGLQAVCPNVSPGIILLRFHCLLHASLLDIGEDLKAIAIVKFKDGCKEKWRRQIVMLLRSQICLSKVK